jgi:RNA polymerase sigma factor (sigma-70 family)
MTSPDDETLLRLVEVATHRYRTHADHDEIKQIAAEAILKQIKRCKTRGVRPSCAYLLKRGKSSIAEWLKRQRTCATLSDNTGADDDNEAHIEAVDFLKSRMHLLDDAEQELLRMRFWEGLTLEQIGERLGLGRRRAGERLDAVLKKLKAGTVGEG